MLKAESWEYGPDSEDSFARVPKGGLAIYRTDRHARALKSIPTSPEID